MSTQNPFDPFALWKDLYDKTETQWSKTFDESMRKEDFSAWMGQFLNLYLQYQNMVKQSTENYLAQANVPSRADLSNLASLLVNLEAKVDNLEEMIEEDLSHQISSLNVSREMNRLKTDMKSIDKKLDQLMTLLEKQADTKEVAVKEDAVKEDAVKEVAAAKENEQSKETEKTEA
ncbi:polyhydroxyalkanoic acid synthase subunit PhaR [Aneurinibacillus sp. BA2021]|nr:polyhydroxyalkanoic acid synthase subunit PhaR [Aneurinibacillus sp. BA2021]